MINTLDTAIETIVAREILTHVDVPQWEAEVHLINGVMGIAQVPSGASTGTFEAHELRDMIKKAAKSTQGGTQRAGDNCSEAVQMDALNQELLDRTMISLDNSTNKAQLGANAILAVSSSSEGWCRVLDFPSSLSGGP